MNAHKDPKCSALIAEHGMTGYGVYWCLIEILHEQDGKIEKFPKLYEGLAFALRVDIKQIEALLEALINDYDLLKQDKKYIWSDRVLRNLEERESKKIAKQVAGRIGGQNSGKSRAKTKQIEALLQKNEANEPKESKVKERKGNKKKDIVYNPLPIFEDENFKTELKEKFPDKDIPLELEKMKDWLAANGRRKQDYKAFARNWLRNENFSAKQHEQKIAVIL